MRAFVRFILSMLNLRGKGSDREREKAESSTTPAVPESSSSIDLTRS
jgi:hypothetical protein